MAQLGIVYAVGEADEDSEPLRDKLRASYSPLVGFCIMLFMRIWIQWRQEWRLFMQIRRR